MKIIFVIPVVLISFFCNAQNTNDIKAADVETLFRNQFGRELFQSLKDLNLGDSSLSAVYYYSYRVTEQDSLIWKKSNWQTPAIDSMALECMMKVFTSFKNQNKIGSLKNPAFTYIPVFILYKIKPQQMLKEKVELWPIEELFGWAMNTEADKQQPVNRMFAPFFFRFPVTKEYIKKE